jgi:CRP/FNR family transcriptional regulator, cyclic AMP receptor protein
MARRAEPGTSELVHLLDWDEDLLATIPEEDLEIARRNLVAEVHRFDSGLTTSFEDCTDDACAGLLVLEGLLTRDVEFAGRRSRELLGEGDILRPRDTEKDFMPPFSSASFSVLAPTRVAYLGEGVLRLGARWPKFVDEIVRRAMQRGRWLAIRLAIDGATRIDDRLNLFLWHAAGRWGRVTAEGVVLPLKLTHETLAELIGAQRPSVTTALTELRKAGRLEIREGEFVLLGDPPGQAA